MIQGLIKRYPHNDSRLRMDNDFVKSFMVNIQYTMKGLFPLRQGEGTTVHDQNILWVSGPILIQIALYFRLEVIHHLAYITAFTAEDAAHGIFCGIPDL